MRSFDVATSGEKREGRNGFLLVAGGPGLGWVCGGEVE